MKAVGHEHYHAYISQCRWQACTRYGPSNFFLLSFFVFQVQIDLYHIQNFIHQLGQLRSNLLMTGTRPGKVVFIGDAAEAGRTNCIFFVRPLSYDTMNFMICSPKPIDQRPSQNQVSTYVHILLGTLSLIQKNARVRVVPSVTSVILKISIHFFRPTQFDFSQFRFLFRCFVLCLWYARIF